MAVRDAGTRQNQFVLRVSLNGTPMGIWDNKTGGSLDSEELKYSPGGGGTPPQSLGGKKIAENVTLQRLYDRKDDHDKINLWLNAVGRGKITLSQKPLDENDNEYGRPVIWTGTLKRTSGMPDANSDSGNSAAMFEIEVTIAGYPAAV